MLHMVMAAGFARHLTMALMMSLVLVMIVMGGMIVRFRCLQREPGKLCRFHQCVPFAPAADRFHRDLA
ncbi:hypothetical protein D3C78_1020620 [compost metagenome]